MSDASCGLLLKSAFLSGFQPPYFLLLCYLVPSKYGEYVSFWLAILDDSVGGHQAFEFFKPVENDVDLARFLFDHHELLAVSRDIVI